VAAFLQGVRKITLYPRVKPKMTTTPIMYWKKFSAVKPASPWRDVLDITSSYLSMVQKSLVRHREFGTYNRVDTRVDTADKQHDGDQHQPSWRQRPSI
jgi:hypothetical protein